jgi:hypothetical protein
MVCRDIYFVRRGDKYILADPQPTGPEQLAKWCLEFREINDKFKAELDEQAEWRKKNLFDVNGVHYMDDSHDDGASRG